MKRGVARHERARRDRGCNGTPRRMHSRRPINRRRPYRESRVCAALGRARARDERGITRDVV